MALPPPETAKVARLLARTARRIARRPERWGIASEDDPLADDDPPMAALGGASVRSRIATESEASDPGWRLGDRVEPVEEAADALIFEARKRSGSIAPRRRPIAR